MREIRFMLRKDMKCTQWILDKEERKGIWEESWKRKLGELCTYPTLGDVKLCTLRAHRVFQLTALPLVL